MAFIPEAIISKVVEELTNLTFEEIRQNVRLVVGVENEVEKLTRNLRAIQEVLADAEQKQFKDGRIRLWLDELREISYEIDDVVDEWNSAMLIKSRDHSPPASVHTLRKIYSFITSCSCCCRCYEIGIRHDIARKIKDLNERLSDIAKRRKNYDLVGNVQTGAVGRTIVGRTTISVISTTEVKGRVKEIEHIIKMLVSASDSAPVPQIISVVGMGGLGKTTLAQSVYNDARAKEHFDVRVWVCVSDPFDEIKIAKAILESLGGSGRSELETVVQDIKNRINGKKILLVLDDVWNEDTNKWEKVKAALTSGSPGSIVLVTTRKERAARIMGCEESKLFRPGHLSKEECWSIISNEVALSGMAKEELQGLEDIGVKIADKCKGLPLAAKALGGLLRFKESRREWQSVLDSEMWELGEEEIIGRDLFAPLWLSYQDLSPPERQCLSYCVCYPKDENLKKDDVIKLWMAQGYIKEAQTKDMELVAEEYFRNLCARSFFQPFMVDKEKYKSSSDVRGPSSLEKYMREDSKTEKFVLHDVVYDFVQFISNSNKECLHLENGELEDKMLDSLYKPLRHLVFSRRQHKLPGSFFSFKKLRSLQFLKCRNLDLCILFSELSCLRSLSIIDCDTTEIPPTIGGLIHLRLLDLRSNDKLKDLPETVGDLCNLLILNLSGCYDLIELPRGIEKLSNLRYLIKHDFQSIRLTRAIGRLNALREAYFIVDGCGGNNAEETSPQNLRNLNHLNFLRIYFSPNVDHLEGAKQAQLYKKNHLVNLQLSLNSGEGDQWQSHDEELIEALRPHFNLEELTMEGYRGVNPRPSWLLSLVHLRKLALGSWDKNCYQLPPLGKLPSLKCLELAHMKVKRVSLQFLGIEICSNEMSFPRLERLYFKEFEEWEEWDVVDWHDQFTVMPCLNLLSVDYCRKLKTLPDQLIQKSTLKSLKINRCHLLAERYQRNGGKDWHKVSHIPHIYIENTTRHDPNDTNSIFSALNSGENKNLAYSGKTVLFMFLAILENFHN